MDDMQAKVVIVGAGHAGGALALELRKLGHTGPITLVGTEQHLPYERPSLSKELLTGADDEPTFVAEAAVWAEKGIELRLRATAERIARADHEVHLADGSVLGYDHLVLATGGAARSLVLDGMLVATLRHVEDTAHLRERAASARSAIVVGGGVIGLETAASLRKLGLAVTVIERAPHLMARNVPPDMAARLEAVHREAGVTLCLGRQIASARHEAGVVQVTLDDGATMGAELVLAGIGIVPGTALASAAGLPCPDGIAVDDRYVTADPAISAVGDVACPPGGRHESWGHAQSSARAAALAILGLPAESVAVNWFWTVQHGHTLQIAGDPMRGTLAARGAVSLYLDGDTVAGVAALDSGREFGAARRLVGKRVDPARAIDPAADLRKLAS